MEKKTKEVLVVELAKVVATCARLEAADKTIRENISKMLAAPTMRKQYAYSDPEPTVYSWPEIYYHLGRLMTRRDYLDLTKNVQEVERQLRALSQDKEPDPFDPPTRSPL